MDWSYESTILKSRTYRGALLSDSGQPSVARSNREAFKSMKIVDAYGALREIFLIGAGSLPRFPVGFPTGCH